MDVTVEYTPFTAEVAEISTTIPYFADSSQEKQIMGQDFSGIFRLGVK
ncbi:MAG: hypothetical protein V8S14_06175 [Lachnospiraceae bacterium]